MSRKERMCGPKLSFRTRAKAQEIADKYGQRVYECPVCFCFHCTSKENWQDEFITKHMMDVEIMKVRTELNLKLKPKNKEIMALKVQIKELKEKLERYEGR